MEKYSEKIRWGIVGLGKIARKFAEDLALHDDAELVAVASNSEERGRDFSDEFQVRHVFDSYEALFACDEVDVIYIANVHTQHAATAILAMDHGKHVLCEKPAGMNAQEVQEMIRASRENRVFFMEALWSRFNPSIRKIKDLIDEGALGRLRYIHADFCFYALDRDVEGRLLNPELGGGSLLDIGIYPVFLAYLLLGAPDEIDARSKFFHTGAEVQTSMLFNYPNAQAVLHSSLANTAKMEARISGEKGEIYIHPRWHEASGFTIVKEEEEEKTDLPVTGKGYYHEIEEVHQGIRRGVLESELWSQQDSLQLIRLLDKIREHCGITFPF
ncbi:Gfo/Idh/MocA family oxidoreductase [Robertkochia marina]|uniref:Gfo/Idh/MocA family oxidoreductase n=1 Tax=Robertkochia marina TaxID=1227945 RepID=A0A4S3LYU2_9FLAO|nr:Gfo/Idh/MocA family oxidoreductase [Robertkochia marina]THD66465.1 Gfo/Idh/MocA family oxidoreductase [Robertkochia marina]TRZ44142.1 gfo/Idh/MocA family oxidoreductase [Robertkochia marina]